MRRPALLPIVLLAASLSASPAVAQSPPVQTAPQETPPPAAPAPAPAPPAAPAATPAAPAAAPVPQGPLLQTKVVPFRVGESVPLGLVVGNLRVPEVTVTRDEANMVQEVVPPSGGSTRYSYLRYTIATENPSGRSWRLAARIRLLDRNGAVVDEFELTERIGKGRAEPVRLKRLTLNYAIQYIDRMEVSFSAS